MKQEKEADLKYFAFISYKREDEKWAIKLKRTLEYYRLPSSLNGKNLPKNMRYVFRDIEELKSGDLSEQIKDALAKSHNLIVICSPRAHAEPYWINKEIHQFVEFGKTKKIHPFIVEGFPHAKNKDEECFPSALLKLTGEQERIGGNINEGGYDFAAVKLIAGMLDIENRDLWDVYRKEQKKKRLIWGCIITFLFTVVIGVATWIWTQNKIIESQNVQLLNLVRNLEEENNTYSQLESEQKQYTFVGQLRGYDYSNIISWYYDYHPYEPIVAFIDDWGVWIHYIYSNIEVNLPTYYNGEKITNFSELRFSADGTMLMAKGQSVTEWNWIDFIWSCEDYTLIRKSMGKENYPDKSSPNTHLDNKINYECKNGKLYIYDIIQHEDICSTDFNSDELKPRCIYNPSYDEILFISEDKAALYDDKKKDFVIFFKGYLDYGFSESGDYLRVDNNIFVRTVRTDTLQHFKYSVHRIEDFPKSLYEDNQRYDSISHSSLDIDNGSIVYKCGKCVKEIKVVEENEGKLNSNLTDAIFAGSNKVIAIVEKGRFKIYNLKTLNLVGTLTNYIWTGFDGIGHEEELSDCVDNHISLVKYINNKLYVLSSGGVIRIYDMNKYRLETVIELPIERNGEYLSGKPIDKCYLTNDASRIYYSFEGQSIYYECELPQIKSNTETE